ncbi:hypothetical protein [Streptomyces sp. NPDC055140]
MNDALSDPEAAQLVDSLVASGGGVLSYGLGAGGREIAVAAGALLATDTGTQLMVVDSRLLRHQIRATVTASHPDLTWAFMSIGEAIQYPERNIGGVLVITADLTVDRLRNPGILEALRARADTADRVIVASRHVDEPVLNAFASQHARFVLSPGVPASPVSYQPRHHAMARGADETETVRPSAAPSHVQFPPPSIEIDLWAGVRRKQQFIRQLSPAEAPAQDPVSYEDLGSVMDSVDPDELRARAEQVRARQRQRAADYPAPPEPDPGRPAPQAHEQAVGYQQNRPPGPGRA